MLYLSKIEIDQHYPQGEFFTLHINKLIMENFVYDMVDTMFFVDKHYMVHMFDDDVNLPVLLDDTEIDFMNFCHTTSFD